jgi:NADH dehydrogenase
VRNVDCAAATVTLTENGTLSFTYLILALGAESYSFDVPGVIEHARRFKTFDDAISIRNAIVFEYTRGNPSPRIVIAGGGPTGVELAAEIEEWVCELRTETKNRCNATVTILESTPTILNGFSKRVTQRTMDRLAALGVHTRLNATVARVETDHVILKNEMIVPFDVFIWTAGVRAVHVPHTPQLQSDVRRRMSVTAHGLCIPHDEQAHSNNCIYAIGDLSCFTDPLSHAPAPQVARAAIEQGAVSAQSVFAAICNAEGLSVHATPTYRFRRYPYIVPVGGKYAIAQIGPVIFSGFFAWMFKGIVELHYLLSILPFFTALDMWLRGFIVFIKNDRLG